MSDERDTLRAQLAETQRLLEAQQAVGDKLTAESQKWQQKCFNLEVDNRQMLHDIEIYAAAKKSAETELAALREQLESRDPTKSQLGRITAMADGRVEKLEAELAALREISTAALAVLKAVDFNHETKETPLKYTVPWLEIVALRKAFIAAGIKTEGEYKLRDALGR